MNYNWISIPRMAYDLIQAPIVHTGEWQSMNTAKSRHHATHELEDVTFTFDLPTAVDGLQSVVKPDLPWAEDHFLERVSGIPHNPPPSAPSWPYAVRGHADHTDDGGRFDHTYPERFWPRFANEGNTRPNGRHVFVPHNGIRFAYGDLSDVVDLLVRNPLTRQAYLPVWFPEDTGASAHKAPYDPSPIRVPCTLGYHFMIRDGRLSCRYYIRSCDMRRHFINDVYLAARLTQWMCNEVVKRTNVELGVDDPGGFIPGRLVMHISSLHCFVGDVQAIHERFISEDMPR